MIRTYLTVASITVIMVGALIYGFTLVGFPWETRERAFDQTRVTSIRNLRYSIENYTSQNQKLPDRLGDIPANMLPGTSAKDPETGQEYEYMRTGKNSYKICANFTTSSDQEKDRLGTTYYYTDEQLDHPKGRHCFELQVSDYLINDAQNSGIQQNPLSPSP